MILGALLNPVNSSMLAVALVPIGIAFGAPPSETVWLVTGLYLATAVGQPVVGRLVDRYGPRPLYLLGAALVGLAGVLGAVAPNLGTLVLARVLIGIGTCAGYPAAMYLIRREADRTGTAQPERHPRRARRVDPGHRGHRPDPRRLPHRGRRLAHDLPRQRPARAGLPGARMATPAAHPDRPSPTPTSRPASTFPGSSPSPSPS